jgi:hypothetical protein
MLDGKSGAGESAGGGYSQGYSQPSSSSAKMPSELLDDEIPF